MKKIVLVTGPDGPDLDAKVAAFYAEQPSSRIIVRTRDDLVRWLSKPQMTAVIKTITPVLEIRQQRLALAYPSAQIEVVSLDA